MVAFWMCELAPDKAHAARQRGIDCRGRLGPPLSTAPDRVLRAMVIDDRPDATCELARLMRCWRLAVRDGDGYIVQTAADERPDVILLDIDQPDLDGMQIARELRLACPPSGCLMIALTSQAHAARRAACVAAGFDLVLDKPIDPDVLVTLLMLECIRVNRSRPRDWPELAPATGRPFFRPQPAAPHRPVGGKAFSRVPTFRRATRPPAF